MHPREPGVVLLDIEGTTTPIAFVHDTLFSYARRHLPAWVDGHYASREFDAIARTLASEHVAESAHDTSVPPWHDRSDTERRASVLAFAAWLMDRDRKSPGLKQLQGLVWEAGYQAGELRGVVFDDVPRAMQRWRARGVMIAIYSSGSGTAQRRLFESAAAGDLTPLISHFFDTAVGAKVDSASYARIAAILGRPAADVLFVSDVTPELRAARTAGLQTLLSVRPGNPPQPDADEFTPVTSFDAILPVAS